MKQKLLFLSAFICCNIFNTNAQEKTSCSLPIELSVFNNGTFMPGAGALGIWSKTFHPGISLGTRYYYRDTDKYQLFQTAKLGYFHHQYAQKGIQLYSEFGYRYKIRPSFFAEAKLGVGYLHSIPDLDVFKLKNGQYQKQSWKSRHQIMAGLSLGIGYNIQSLVKRNIDVYAAYQFWIQSPFVNKYVPILPNNSVHLGIIYHHNWTSQKSKN